MGYINIFGHETQQFAKLFKDADIRIAFRTINTIQKHLQPKKQRCSKYDNSDVHKIKCPDCPLQYIGQTGRSFQTMYKEYIRVIKYNKVTSNYAPQYERQDTPTETYRTQ
jgi:hypothetical protein